jgi:hypothetical protein
MIDRPAAPLKTGRRTIANADVPSETVKTGLPSVGEGASAAHFARDAVSLNAGEGHEDSDGVKEADEVRGRD